ncbi:hypothetical protein ABZP36_022968 [Zizania latifolia]
MDPPGKAAATTVGAQLQWSPGKGTTLLDVYEVEWITRELERLLAKTESGCGGGVRDRKGKKVVCLDPKPSTCRKGGFLTEIVGRHAVSICGDTAAAVARARPRRGRGSFREVEKV